VAPLSPFFFVRYAGRVIHPYAGKIFPPGFRELGKRVSAGMAGLGFRGMYYKIKRETPFEGDFNRFKRKAQGAIREMDDAMKAKDKLRDSLEDDKIRDDIMKLLEEHKYAEIGKKYMGMVVPGMVILSTKEQEAVKDTIRKHKNADKSMEKLEGHMRKP